MCLVVWGWKVHPEYPLIFIANRDEAYDRQTQALAPWHTTPEIYAGRDGVAQGTWAGMTATGRFAAVTNVRRADTAHPPTADLISRGQLVRQFLEGRQDPATYIARVEAEKDQYAGFNLVTGNLQQLMYYSNYSERPRSLRRGIYALSNGLLNDAWPKAEETKVAFTRAISCRKPSFDELFDMMQNPRTYPPRLLPETGLSPAQEVALSAVFVKTPDYGTRSTLLMVVNHKEEVLIEERSYDRGEINAEAVDSQQQYTFSLDRA